jgi:hypothetical protein
MTAMAKPAQMLEESWTIMELLQNGQLVVSKISKHILTA